MFNYIVVSLSLRDVDAAILFFLLRDRHVANAPRDNSRELMIDFSPICWLLLNLYVAPSFKFALEFILDAAS